MYRSQSTSFVFVDPLSWNSHGDYTSDSGEVTCATGGQPIRTPAEESATSNTLASALNGSKMATSPSIQNVTGTRTLPRALQPKTGRSACTPAQSYQPNNLGPAPSVGLPSSTFDNGLRRSSFSGSVTSLATRSPVPLPGMTDAATNHPRSPSTGRWSIDVPRDDGRSWPVNRVESGGSQQRAPVVISGRSRKREPVVQDSIYPLLRAAFGRDTDESKKAEEEHVTRQVFGRLSRSSISVSQSSCFPDQSASVHSVKDSDDVFVGSPSHPSLPNNATLPRFHFKSSSEVLPSRGLLEDRVQMHSRQRSHASSSGNLSMYGTKSSRDHVGRAPPSPLASAAAQSDQHASSGSSTHRYGRTMSPLPPPPKGRRPASAVPLHSCGTRQPTHLASSEKQVRALEWYDPIPVEARKVIRSPRSISLSSPQRSREFGTPALLPSSSHSQSSTGYHASQQAFFGESFSPASYPLLSKVERMDVDSVWLDSTEVPKNKGTTSVHSEWNDERFLPIANSRNSRVEDTDNEPSGSREAEQMMHLQLVLPPTEFRDDDGIRSSAPPFFRPPLPLVPPPPSLPLIGHQATDSINTEDSGLERWEKEGHDHFSADELEAGHVIAMTSDPEREKTTKGRIQSSNSREDDISSEGRGSLSSSPRPLIQLSSDDRWSSLTDCTHPLSSTTKPQPPPPPPQQQQQLQNESEHRRKLIKDESSFPIQSNSILQQLLAENRRQVSLEPEVTVGGLRQENFHLVARRTPESNANEIASDTEFGGAGPPGTTHSRSDSADVTDSLDSRSNLSTAVQSSVTGSCDTIDLWDRTRLNDCWRYDEGKITSGSGHLRVNSSGSANHGMNVEELQKQKTNCNESAEIKQNGLCTTAATEFVKEDPVTHDVSIKTSVSETSKQVEGLRQELKASRHEKEENSGVLEGDKMTLEIIKSSVGVGFCIEGGKGSLSGDRPIVVKRIFKGEYADDTRHLRPGDELLSIGGQSLQGFSHYEAWKYIKALPNGTVQLAVRRQT